MDSEYRYWKLLRKVIVFINDSHAPYFMWSAVVDKFSLGNAKKFTAEFLSRLTIELGISKYRRNFRKDYSELLKQCDDFICNFKEQQRILNLERNLLHSRTKEGKEYHKNWVMEHKEAMRRHAAKRRKKESYREWQRNYKRKKYREDEHYREYHKQYNREIRKKVKERKLAQEQWGKTI